MKTKESKPSSNQHPATSVPFFSKAGTGDFFSNGSEVEQPFFQPSAIQANLAVGAPDDPYEQEAEKVSRQVMDSFGQVSSLQTKLAPFGMQPKLVQPMSIRTYISRRIQKRLDAIQAKCDECEKEGMAQPKSLGIQFAGDGAMIPSNIESMIQSQRGGGSTMDLQTKTAMETSFGADFSGVRVHTGGSAVQMSQELNAHAFTVGNDIFFNQGRYQPSTKEGAGLLAHELTHTVQQGASAQTKRINRQSLLSSLSSHTAAHLSALNGESSSTLNRKEIEQLQQLPEEEVMKVQQLQMLQMEKVDKVQKKDNSLKLRRCVQKVKKKAKLKSGPTYSPGGTIAASLQADGSKKALFDMSAEFDHDPTNNIFSSCGEIRQYIMWSSDADRPRNGAFDATFNANDWHEDRDSSGKRYGHRNGGFSECVSINHYEDLSGNQDCANGNKFVGQDTPTDGSGAKKGWWKFKLVAMDTCNSNKELGTDFVTIDW